jgi:hypothetical protein
VGLLAREGGAASPADAVPMLRLNSGLNIVTGVQREMKQGVSSMAVSTVNQNKMCKLHLLVVA